MELALKKTMIVKECKFEIVVINWNELRERFTTSDVFAEAESRRYTIPTKEQAYAMRHILGRNYAGTDIGVWIVVALTKDEDGCGAAIVSGVCGGNEGRSVPDYGKNPAHVWEPIAFAFLASI